MTLGCKESVGYRPYIDGLRALSVIAVVVYHLHLLPKPFATRGGFTGVDVFFVISGFLISKIIINEVNGGNFSFLQFYARRARRILPAMMVMCTLTMICGLFLLHPLEFARLSNEFLAALGFVSNIYFYNTANYFGPTSTDLPLLHLWSLGVEEQFYLLFPLVIVLLARYSRGVMTHVIVVLLAASLIAAQIALARNPQAAFFLLPFRAFELLIGCLLALPTLKTTSNIHIARTAGVVGLLLLTYSFHFLRETMQFPGLAALPACLGAALIIWSGECLASWPTRFVGCAPLVYIGRRSYSIYLYHWPAMLFVSRLLPDNQVNGVAALGITLALSWLSYRFIEQPFRHTGATPLRSLRMAGSSILAAALVALFVSATGGLAWRVDAKVNSYLAFLNYSNADQFRAKTCFLPIGFAEGALPEECLSSSENPVIVIWGDSGVAQYASEFDKAFRTRGFRLRQATASACPPAISTDIEGRPQCRPFNDLTLRRVRELNPKLVILGAAWGADEKIFDGVEQTVAEIQKAGIRVLVLGLGPAYKIPVPKILAERHRENNRDTKSGVDLLRVWSLETDSKLLERIRHHPGAGYVSIIKTVCPLDDCPLLAGATPVHFDLFHVTEAGAALFVGQLTPQIFKFLDDMPNLTSESRAD